MKPLILIVSSYPTPKILSRVTGHLPDELASRGARVIALSTQEVPQDVHLMVRGNRIKLLAAGEILCPRAIVQISTLEPLHVLREPPAARFPDLFRSRAVRFLTDIKFSLEGEVEPLPASTPSIAAAEVKSVVLAAASSLGLVVPAWTSVGCAPIADGSVRKSLGHAFAACRERGLGELIGVSVGTVPAGQLDGEPGPFIWQSEVAAEFQIRCFVLAEHVWSAVWRRPSGGKDLRTFQFGGERAAWEPYELPGDVSEKLILLARRFGLAWCAPEFLVDADGGHVLIDLNPVGEWGGFFSEAVTREITVAVASRVLEPSL